ncbi:MAG TPA: dephospho-CoA kinase [Herpetosiphon sp.]|uniref:Dephospho-CoA kinase n=1 Tax=Herpetosiphon aurantiacus (strain ATCC 23779 / DSM 785 / 114-95) TaxID=316274 RepID=A9B1S4_HERA2|nr:dephospho-CoA kinase [Herpetosiphon sp.]ABX05366.1 dephospho-CoA kinase [Herpetosiphon aurantiacus DSM 785]HBW51163.1 dephospho-CoA kinase [Herpetosiphon sp.]
MYRIGLTGNIACGKSTVVAMLHELGAAVCDADAVVHQVQAPDGSAYTPIVEAFGLGILQNQTFGQPINRQALGQIVFTDQAQLRRLEALVHPIVRQTIMAWLEAQRQNNAQVVVIDAIKLIESGYPALCDAVWVVTADPAIQLARLIETRGMSEAEALLRINAQNSQADKIAHADVVIDNSGSLAETRRQVEQAFLAIQRHD